MTLDLVVQRVGAALGRGHALFSPSPLEVGSSLSASGQSLENVGQRVGAQAQMLDARGAFGREFGAAAGRLGGRIAAAGGADQLLGGAMSGAAGDDAAGRGQSGNVVNAAAGDTARTGPYANTPAGQQALLMALRDRVDDQRKVIAAYRARDAQYAAKIRALAYQQQRGGAGMGGLGQAFSGLGQQMRPGGGSSGGGGGGGLSGLSSLGGLFKNAGNTNSSANGTAGPAALITSAGTVGDLDGRQTQVAKDIVAEGLRRGIPFKGLVIGVATALQESSLRELANRSVPESMQIPHDGVGKDHDSVGPFQQRQSWGATADLMNSRTSAGKFFAALQKVAGWQNMSHAEAAQAVQRSAFPSAYAKHVAHADRIVRALTGATT
ncbi:DUF4226 domain-containing protein [Mycobacteroides abscessus]|uniref:DUF4226 domain-containing protein n=1 Tax=Mycobacteroides abscessus TaxID=36809 RepID=UPI0010477410|nr:DUF4226 domain-containing protein [Mycobacteroides abscessus]